MTNRERFQKFLREMRGFHYIFWFARGNVGCGGGDGGGGVRGIISVFYNVNLRNFIILGAGVELKLFFIAKTFNLFISFIS